MKRIIVLILALLSCFSVCFMVACENAPTGKEPEQIIEPEEDEKTCIVMFDSNGGTEVESITVNKGEKIAKPTDPTRIGNDIYDFVGWFVNGSEWNFDVNTVEENMVLTAKWKAVEIGTKNYLPED